MTTRDGGPDEGPDADSSQVARIAEILDAYLAEVEAGRVVDAEALIRDHPGLADRLRDCLGVLQAVGRVAEGGPTPDRSGDPGLGTLGDYRIIREVGRGGMGIVFEAEQVSLGRRVALKILPFAAALDPAQLARFRLEAQAAALLHHAHIVPIHAIGSERGVHFYAMQFIDGRPLDALIADLRRADPPSEVVEPDAADAGATLLPSTLASARGRAYFRTVAEMGIQVAEALDHAHRLGVVHRDVKPANLILDDLGHLWVADFGLARVQASPGLTSTGHVLGTLRYMSPEQALARRDVVDHRADLYSLGATLYELLTLRPAFDGADRAELLRRIERDEPRPPRRLDPAIPADLETIVLKAMAKEPGRRYATAKDLADDLRRHLDHRPILARRPTPAHRVAKWARRHQAATASAMAALLVSTIVLAVALALLASKDRELARERDEALRQARRAGRNFGHASDAIEAMLGKVGDGTLRDIPRAEPVRRALLEKALAFYQRLADEEDAPSLRRDIAVAFSRVAALDDQLGLLDEAARAFDRSISLFEALSAASPTDRGLRSELAKARENQGILREKRGDYEGAEASHGRAIALYEGLMVESPERRSYRASLSLVLLNRIKLRLRSGRNDEAEKDGLRALELLRTLIAEDPKDPGYLSEAGGLLNNLALIALERRELGKARGFLIEAADRQRAALAINPDSTDSRIFLRNHVENLAVVEIQLRHRDAALEAFRQAVATGEALVADFPDVPDRRWELAGSRNNLANLLIDFGRWDEAERERRKAAEDFDVLAAQHPDATDYLRETAGSHHNLALLLRDRGRFAEAAGEFRRAIEISEKMRVAHPNRNDDRARVVKERLALASLLATCRDPNHRDPKTAVEEARKALELAPKNAAGRGTLGIALCAAGGWDEAAALLEPLAADEKSDAFLNFYLAMALHHRGKPAEARASFDRGVARMDRGARPPEIAHRARAEAAALLGIADPPAVEGPAPATAPRTPSTPK